MQKIEVTVVIAFDNVPDDVDLESLTVDIPSSVRLRTYDNKLVKNANYLGHETEDVIGQEDFVLQGES